MSVSRETADVDELAARLRAAGYVVTLHDQRTTEAGAAALTGYSPTTLKTLRSRGGGPTFVKIRGRVWYPIADLLSFCSGDEAG